MVPKRTEAGVELSVQPVRVALPARVVTAPVDSTTLRTEPTVPTYAFPLTTTEPPMSLKEASAGLVLSVVALAPLPAMKETAAGLMGAPVTEEADAAPSAEAGAASGPPPAPGRRPGGSGRASG